MVVVSHANLDLYRTPLFTELLPTTCVKTDVPSGDGAPAVTVLRELRQGDQKFKVVLGLLVNPKPALSQNKQEKNATVEPIV